MNKIDSSKESIILPQETIILPKEISEVPYSNEVDYITFSKVLKNNKLVATYKMYWLLAILDEVSLGHTEIEFKKLIGRMIVYAWNPILKFKISFGLCDNLSKIINYISDKGQHDKNKILKYIDNSNDKKLNKMLNDLTLNVPYRFISPFFEGKLTRKKNVQELIEEFSKEDRNCIYEIYINEKKGKSIRIKENWCSYLKNNKMIIEGWVYSKLVCFLEKRNLNVPAIAMKLEAKPNRNLKVQAGIWNEIIEEKHISDLYTNLEFTEENYKKHGVLSIDHFIPWSFVLHNQMWNLVPTFKNINSKKSDHLVEYELYKDRLCEIQYEAFSFVVDENRKNQVEEYREILKVENAKKFKEKNDKGEFIKRLQKEIEPVHGIAFNQGF